MKGGTLPRGYTIVEVMIFLAVSSAMLLVAARAISGYQARSEYTQAVRDVESQLIDIANDVGNGYFPYNSTQKCDASSGYPVLSAGSAPQGSNDTCIFIGKAVQFNTDSLDVYTLVGNKKTGVNEVTSLDQVKPRADTVTRQRKNFLFGLKIDRISAAVDGAGSCWNMGVRGLDAGSPNPQCYPNYSAYTPRPSMVAFITSFGKSYAGNLVGSPTTDLYVLKDSRADRTTAETANLLTIASGDSRKTTNPADSSDMTQAYFQINGGYTVCVVKDGKYSAISLGVHGSNVTTRVTIGTC